MRRSNPSAGRGWSGAGALSRLPHAYARALRLQAAGAPDARIAAALGVEVEAVGPLLRIARAKLEALLRPSAPGIEPGRTDRGS